MSKKQTKASRKRPDVSPAAPGTEAAAPGGGEARTAPVRPSPAPGRPPADPEPPLRIGWSAPLRYAILGVLLFLVIALQAGGNDRAAAVGMSLVLIACVFGRMPQWSLRHRLSIPVLAVFAYLLLNSAAGLYSRFGSFAAGELVRSSAPSVCSVWCCSGHAGARRGIWPPWPPPSAPSSASSA